MVMPRRAKAKPSVKGDYAIRRIHLLGFVEEVRHIHANMPDRRFCFVLGAGASKTSLIPTAGELGLDWLKKIHIEKGGVAGDFAKWLSKGTHGIEGLPPKTSVTDIAIIAAAYPAIYKEKWGHDRAQGHAEIEHYIEEARPSYGYYALAEILASDDPANPSRHNVVITPNFDNLPAETLGALGKKIPIVIGHSAITDFARPTLRRPLIIKFHHDFLLAPKSDPKDVSSMEKGYSQALAEIFRLYTPIVIGYGGNDGSLMGLLEKLPEKSIPGGILWCWRTGAPPGQRIEDVVAKQAGTLVEISGFDELMTLLEKPFGHAFNPDKLRQRAQERAQELTEAKQSLAKKAARDLSPSVAISPTGERSSTSPVSAAASQESSAVLDALTIDVVSACPPEKSIMPWWHWQDRINATSDMDEKERLFQEGVSVLPGAAQLLINYAHFLETQRKDDDRAEECYIKAIEADPQDAFTLGNYALFLETQRKDDARAEEYYLKAIDADPQDANNLGNYALFLESQRNDNVRAEEYYLKAIAADPQHAFTLGSYAIFLHTQRKDHARAEEYYLKAIAADPHDSNTLGSYALFLCAQRKDDVRAEEYYIKAIEADPHDAFALSSYALFLEAQRDDNDRAEQYYLKAIEADPQHAFTLRCYAKFLCTQRKDNARAEEYYIKAITADPQSAFTLGDYAIFLQNQHKDDVQAEQYYLKAITADPQLAFTVGNYAQFLIGCNRYEDAAIFAKRAWALLVADRVMGIGEVAYSRWLLAAIAGTDGQQALGRLKTLLQAGYRRYPWNFDAMLAACLPKLTEEQGELARKLAAAILDEGKLAELEADPTWKKVQPIPLDAPWPD